MIGELNIGGVFVPYLLLLAVLAFVLSLCARRVLRAVSFYRFVWHAGLFDIALFVVLLWLVAMITAPLLPYGTRVS
jgi:protein AaeX